MKFNLLDEYSKLYYLIFANDMNPTTQCDLYLHGQGRTMADSVHLVCK